MVPTYSDGSINIQFSYIIMYKGIGQTNVIPLAYLILYYYINYCRLNICDFFFALLLKLGYRLPGSKRDKERSKS